MRVRKSIKMGMIGERERERARKKEKRLSSL